MMRKLRITDPGSTDLLQNVSYEYKEIAEANAAVQARIDAGEEGLTKATYRATLLGITNGISCYRIVTYRQLPPRRPHACLPKPPSRARLTRCSVLRKMLLSVSLSCRYRYALRRDKSSGI